MDRIDIHIDVPAVNYKEMRSTNVPEGFGKDSRASDCGAPEFNYSALPETVKRSTPTPKCPPATCAASAI